MIQDALTERSRRPRGLIRSEHCVTCSECDRADRLFESGPTAYQSISDHLIRCGWQRDPETLLWRCPEHKETL